MNSNQQKRILFIAPSPLYVEKGSSLRMYAILEILAKHYKIDLVTYSTGRDFSIENVTIYRTPGFYKPNLAIGKPSSPKLILDFLMYLKIIRLSLFNKYNILHCEDFEGIALGYFSSWLNRRSKYVYDLHNRILDNLYLNSKPKKLRDSIVSFLEKKFVKRSDKIILNWNKYYNDPLLSTKPTFLYYDPIDTALADIEVPSEPYLIYSGNFEEYQGLSDFIPVFARSNTPFKLFLIGEPSKVIEDLIIKLDCSDKVRLLGRKTIAETNAYINSAIAGILPRREGSCMKAIHYVLWDKPVIAKNTPSNKEMVYHEKNGFLYANEMELHNILILLNVEDVLENLKPSIKIVKNQLLNSWDPGVFIRNYEN